MKDEKFVDWLLLMTEIKYYKLERYWYYNKGFYTTKGIYLIYKELYP